MTAVSIETMKAEQETTARHSFEKLLNGAKCVGTFVLDRFTMKGDHQMAQETVTPIYFHESYPVNGLRNIALGEE